SGDHTILLWHIPQRTALGSAFRGHTDWVNSLAFSPKGDTLYSGGRDGRLIAWQTGLNLWQARACQIANRNLTPDEQQRYFPGTIAAHTICPPFNQEAG
ncbi:MAG TPA: hypothetical protein VKY59_00905, partial [Spirillospora sp.]|nr:hypothetical protein [Spirillospora sp.]